MVLEAHHTYSRLVDTLKGYGRVVVAFSGGVDSTLVVKAAADALGPENMLAATGVSASLGEREQDGAVRTLQDLNLAHRHRLIGTYEQDNPLYRANNPDRCFHCKTELYTQLEELAARENFNCIANGANTDDLSDYRPGMKAAKNYSVRSPLVEAGLAKADVRSVALHLSLPNWDKPAAPCLASRVPHGTEVNPEVLSQIGKAEAFLSDLGLSEFRVRHHEDVARIEALPDSWAFFDDAKRRTRIERAFESFGYRFVALDLGGYRMGKAVIR